MTYRNPFSKDERREVKGVDILPLFLGIRVDELLQLS